MLSGTRFDNLWSYSVVYLSCGGCVGGFHVTGEPWGVVGALWVCRCGWLVKLLLIDFLTSGCSWTWGLKVFVGALFFPSLRLTAKIKRVVLQTLKQNSQSDILF